MFGLTIGNIILSLVLYALTLLGIAVLVKGANRRLLVIGYTMLTLFIFHPIPMLIATAVTLGLAWWIR